MTTSSASEPDTGNALSTGPSMDRKASSPSISTSFTSPEISSTDTSPTLVRLHEKEFVTAATKVENDFEDTIDSRDGAELEQGSTRTTIRSSMESTPTSLLSESPPTSISVATQDSSDASSIGQQNATSFVPNGTHDGHKATANRSRRASHVQQQQRTQQKQYETEPKEMGISVLVGCDAEGSDNNTITTPTSASPTSSSLEHSSILYADMDMFVTSSTRNAKSPPTSTTSSISTGRRKIAESSMILSAGTLPAATSIAAGGSLSPAWSMTSIPRDISAAYNQNLEQREPSADEKLYGLVDRYGFLVEEGRTPISDRSTIQATLTSSQRSVRPINEPKTQAKTVEKEQERSLKWAKMAKQYTSEAKETEYSFPNNSKFIKRVYKGIPDCWRAAAWSFIVTKRSANFEPNIRQIYQDMLSVSSSEEEQIDLDIPRTMHGHIMFRTRYGPGQCALFKKTFVLLTQLFERYNINNLVVPGFPALFEAFYIQEELTKIYAPRVFEALETMGIATASYASRWYITLYSAGVVPYRTLLRIWDIFLLEGFDWLYFMALALLKYHESSLTQNNFEQTMEMLNAKMDIQDDDRLVRIARKLFKQALKTGIVAKLKEQYAANQRLATTAP
ncbi:hypothetical protein BGZ80_009774 [Entomortierella chlamydospora]|uniref:Rab-GAP TBC domain-containing protein n=1 Tax=Entomortierella chlamydospora TaxID=101097 RepID=A0A9P6MX32_9FUNG|nr:hypothetical protein BGZ80_009774 [Entomortierella chlamydospora]